jgi:DNA-binding transcriptional LysR family regulator
MKIDKLDFIKQEYKVFKIVAESLSMTKAQDKLKFNQPQISKYIKKLEEEIGVTLFIRTKNGLKLTLHARELLIFLNSIEETQKQKKSNDYNLKKLIIGCHNSLAFEYLPLFLPKLNLLLPQTEIEIIFLPSIEISDLVSKNEIDIGIVTNPLKERQLIAKKINVDFAAYFCSPSSITKEKYLLVHPQMLKIAKQNISADQIILIPDYEVMAKLVLENGQYAAILPGLVARRYNLDIKGNKLFEVNISAIVHESRFEKGIQKSLFELFQT